jgi:Mg2+ and Co2+ transporter CorA
MCGTLFGFSSFLLGRFGVNLEQQLLAWSATAGTGFAGAMMILLAILLLARGLKPVMTVKGIILKPR